MITTPDLIESLATSMTPVRRLWPPLIRAGCWLLLAAIILGLLAVSQGIRPDLPQHLRQAGFTIGMGASLLTGICAAIAAFMLSLPDRSRLWLLLPIPALFVWLSTIGYQCLTDWISFGPNGMQLGETLRCFATLVFSGFPLSFALLVMLRYAAPLRPTATALTGSLAVAAITATALSLLHQLDATVMILIWNLGIAAIMVGIGSLAGRRMFSLVAPRSLLHRD